MIEAIGFLCGGAILGWILYTITVLQWHLQEVHMAVTELATVYNQLHLELLAQRKLGQSLDTLVDLGGEDERG